MAGAHAAQDETILHLLMCPDGGMRIMWASSVKSISIWLEEATHIQKLWNASDKAALQIPNTDHSFTAHSMPLTILVAEEQDQIGWKNFVEGKILRK